MLSVLKFIAVLAAALFAGAALYINVAEHPARMSLETKSAAAEWGSAETHALLERWARLHAVRTTLSLAATVLCVCLALGS
jgi:Domain of unknown function (DUF1772)